MIVGLIQHQYYYLNNIYNIPLCTTILRGEFAILRHTVVVIVVMYTVRGGERGRRGTGPYTNSEVIRSRSNEIRIGRVPCNTIDCSCVSTQCLQHGSVLSVPYIYITICRLGLMGRPSTNKEMNNKQNENKYV